MGFQYLRTCYETAGEAAAEYYQSQSQEWQVDNSPMLVKYYWNGSAWRQHKIDINSNGVASIAWDKSAEVVQFPYCAEVQPTGQFLDGVALGWGVVLAMAIAWGFREMKRNAK